MQGSELREVRQKLGLTQEQLAAALDMTPTYIGLMERGVKAIEVRTSWLIRLIQNAIARRESLLTQIDMMEVKKTLRTLSGNVDTTQESIAMAKHYLAETEDLLERLLPKVEGSPQ
jgi:transcriptional regulator with XRE-family HTH domain